MKQRKEDRGKGHWVYQMFLKSGRRVQPLSRKSCRKKLPKLRGVLWRVEWMSFPHEELMEIIGKLDKKLEEVENIIDFKKGETNKMIECTVHDSHMKGLSAIQGLDIYVPMEYSRRTLEGGVDEFSLEELMNIIDLKKGETNSMNEHTVHGSHMKGLSASEGLDSYVPTLDDGVDEFSYEELMENDWGILDQDDKWFCEEWLNHCTSRSYLFHNILSLSCLVMCHVAFPCFHENMQISC
ncbi:hypothetical protein CK203_051235 [Vitis vinifera]|uniref:Uncharacterized protein n=1 Tax=Vitis vinifera TaxID=29760 RepID=A0A438H7U0_VITVI|nr:hypothetical protein CK203_051235 [Vitis vinifera]